MFKLLKKFIEKRKVNNLADEIREKFPETLMSRMNLKK